MIDTYLFKLVCFNVTMCAWSIMHPPSPYFPFLLPDILNVIRTFSSMPIYIVQGTNRFLEQHAQDKKTQHSNTPSESIECVNILADFLFMTLRFVFSSINFCIVISATILILLMYCVNHLQILWSHFIHPTSRMSCYLFRRYVELAIE